eukprot:13597643-Ditylum_brightwellii.AAC.2
MKDINDILMIDSGGGRNSTVMSMAWYVFEKTNHKQDICGYGNKDKVRACNIVNVITKSWISGKKEPVLFVVNYVALNDDNDGGQIVDSAI